MARLKHFSMRLEPAQKLDQVCQTPLCWWWLVLGSKRPNLLHIYYHASLFPTIQRKGKTRKIPSFFRSQFCHIKIVTHNPSSQRQVVIHPTQKLRSFHSIIGSINIKYTKGMTTNRRKIQIIMCMGSKPHKIITK